MKFYLCFLLLSNLLIIRILSDSTERINYLEVFNLNNARNIDLIVCGEKNFEMGQKEINEDYQLFASFSSVRQCIEIDRKNWTSLHDKNRIAIMLLPANISSFNRLIDYVGNIHANDTYKWKPFWIFIFPHYISREDIGQHENHFRKIESTLNKCQLNSQVFVLFFLKQLAVVSNDLNDKIVAFEIYAIKNVTVVEQYHPVMKTKMLFEILNNKAKRRHFHEVTISGVAVHAQTRSSITSWLKHITRTIHLALLTSLTLNFLIILTGIFSILIKDDPQTQLMTRFEEVNGEVRFKDGFAVEAFNYVADSLNFTRKAMKAEGHLTQQTNGSVSGMGLILINKLADILVVNSELLEYRIKELTFLPSFYSAKLNAFFIQPPASNFRNIYLQPFKLDLWISILLSWLVIVVCLMLFSLIKEKMNMFIIEEFEDHQIARDSFLWAVSAITQKGWYMNPRAVSMKAVFITGLFTAVLTYTSYAAVIISTLSVVRDPIKSMTDLENSGIEIFADDLLESSFNVVKTIARHRGRFTDDNLLKIQVAQAVIQLNHPKPKAIVTTEDLFYFPTKKIFADRDICQKISKITVPGPNIQGGMYIRAYSPFREHFKHRFLMFRESGVSKRNNLDYRRKTGLSCSTSMDANHFALGISDVFSAFILLTFAFICSWLALNFEKIYSWIKIKRTLVVMVQ